VTDAAAKIALLKGEIEFSEALSGTLETLQVAAGMLDQAQEALREGEVGRALEKVVGAERVLGGLGEFRGARFVGLLARRAGSVREEVASEVKDVWGRLVRVDAEAGRINVRREIEGEHKKGFRGDNLTRIAVPMNLESVAEAMDTLGILSSVVSRFHRDFDTIIVGPRILATADGSVPRIEVTTTQISAAGRHRNTNALDMIEDVYKITSFLDEAFPESISRSLLEKVLPSLLLKLVSGWLDPSMPLRIDNLDSFRKITTQVEALANFMAQHQVELPSDADLRMWLKRMPQNWLARRKEVALADMRSRLYSAVKVKQTAEKVETQVINSDDVMYGEQEAIEEDSKNDGQEDEWGDNWGDNEEEDQGHTNGGPKKPAAEEEEEEDTSAWDVDEEPVPAEQSKDSTEETTDEADAWGWNEEESEEPETEASQTPLKAQPKPAKTVKKQQPSTKEITLRETYAVTGIPDTIIDLISTVLSDASTLKSPAFAIPTLGSATPGLSTIPTLLLALFRATAPTYYATLPAGAMLTYNDTQRLTTQLQTLVSTLNPSHPLASRIRLDADIEALTSFARRAYGREMDAQRTILRDILSSASGFVNSTAPLNARQYAAIVADAVKRVRDVNDSWTGVLSDSARLQSLGSLTGTLVKQMIADILERADDPVGISEEQSKQLKGYCDTVAELADLFLEGGENGERRSLVHVYTQDWLRFVYLGEILEASLADIRYLWTEGELSLEFEAGEVVDLIQALFADSVHRKDAIREIRRGK
jgi:protein transport protein DSL1/ZW10